MKKLAAAALSALLCWPLVAQQPPLKCYTVNLNGGIHTYCR